MTTLLKDLTNKLEGIVEDIKSSEIIKDIDEFTDELWKETKEFFTPLIEEIKEEWKGDK